MSNEKDSETKDQGEGIKKLTADDLDNLQGGSMLAEEKKIAGTKMKAPRSTDSLL